MSERSDTAPVTAASLLPRAVCVRRGGIAMACILFAIGLVFVWQASRLDFGGLGLPGPGFFPLALGAILGATSAVIGLACWRESDEEQSVELGHYDVLVVFVALLAVPTVFEWLGAYLTLGVFGAALLILIARTSLWLAVLSAVIAMAACWFFFQLLLGLQLPTGLL
jgi:hypothetical protein